VITGEHVRAARTKERPMAVGDRVRSIAVGKKAAFEGVIEEICFGAYAVRDSDGLWRRTAGELQRLELN
jgi:hypothetical protein